MRLTDLLIKNLKLPEIGQKTYFDDSFRGFGLRVSQGGSKSFVLMFGKDRKLRTIGRYPDMSLADARKKAKQTQGELLSESTQDQEPSPSISFFDARDRFLRAARDRTKPSTMDEYQRLLHKHFHYEKQLSAITRQDVMEALCALRDKPSIEQHAFVALRTMFNWCILHGYMTASPLPPLRFKTISRTRILTDAELAAVWHRACAVGHPYGTIVQLLVLTGQRRGEIAGLRRSWIRHNEIVFPLGFTKNKREHTIPLGRLAQGIIQGVPDTGDMLFPSRISDETPFNGWSKAKVAFDAPLRLPEYTLHDLRRTYSSNMARLGVPIHVTEKLLNHVSGTVSGVAAVYNRYNYQTEMRDAALSYERFLVSITALPERQ